MLLSLFGPVEQETGYRTESCFYIDVTEALTPEEDRQLRWFLGEPSNKTSLLIDTTVLEIGPRLHVETTDSSTAKTILSAVGITKVTRLEKSRRYGFWDLLSEEDQTAFVDAHSDRMTEVRYDESLTSFGVAPAPEPLRIIEVLGPHGKANLLAYSDTTGLGWDEQDLEFGLRLFQNLLRRNATDTELFGGLGQANSEHSRHWKFRGKWIINGQQKPLTLMEMVKGTLKYSNPNTKIAFHDNASAIFGGKVLLLIVADPRFPSQYRVVERLIHPTLTAESHNHPTMIDPYQGMATLIAIIRDQEKVGRGGRIGVLGIGMAVGNLHIPKYDLPWENDGWKTAARIATALQIATRGSQGAFDFANAFGQPGVYGFFRTFGQVLPSGEYRSWYKPVAYGVAAGFIDDAHVQKQDPEPGMLIVHAGGPARRVGVGGGSGSSMLGGESSVKLDFDSVQRGDGEMQNRLDHFERGCIEMLEANPVANGQDMGAGGVINATMELVGRAGAYIHEESIPCADPSLSSRELSSNESQERNVSLVRPPDLPSVVKIGQRENCPVDVIGHVTGNGRYVVHNSITGATSVDLPLDEVLVNLPPKTFSDNTIKPRLRPLQLPPGTTIGDALDRVLRLPAVASKQWLTRRVDRSVTGLVAQQQCVGPNHLPVSDSAIRADSYYGKTGTVFSLGEQPNKGLLSPGAMVRLSVTEALLNMAGARISEIGDIKGSTNWMLAAKVPGQGAWLYEAMEELVVFMEKLRVASHGGKDSLSLAGMGVSPSGEETLVVSPGEFIYAPHARMADITRHVTPYVRRSNTELLLVDLGMGEHHLGGSALAQVYGQIGKLCPDVQDAELVVRTFNAMQALLDRNLITSAHDRSDGGLITTVLEMGFASNLGVRLWLENNAPSMNQLFAEEAGIVLGCSPYRVDQAIDVLSNFGVPVRHLGFMTAQTTFEIQMGSMEIYTGDLLELRVVWEETSYQLDRLLRNPECTEEEKRNTVYLTTPPPYRVTFKPPAFPAIMSVSAGPKLAVLREEGGNGEREMAAYFQAAGFDAWDVTMRDLLNGDITLDSFRGVAMVGGFSFRDVFTAGRGQAGVIRFNEIVREQFERFRARPDTFGLGICNGCQVMGLLDWVPGQFVQNISRQFESRVPTVTILDEDEVFFKGMAGSRLPVWLAHGEGRLQTEHMAQILEQGLAPLRFVDPEAQITQRYPFNPNGSEHGIAGLLSTDKRFLAIMPHIERTGQMWNWPWIPDEMKDFESSPWFQVFVNMRNWCEANK